MRTDEFQGVKGVVDEKQVGKVRVTIYDETIESICARIYSFGFVTRAFFHELVHVKTVIKSLHFDYTQDGGNELNAYYKSSVNDKLPSMTQREAKGNALNALLDLLRYVDPPSNRQAAMTHYSTQVKYFLNVLSPGKKAQLLKSYKVSEP